MWFRSLVNQFIRQAAEGKLYEQVSRARQGGAGPARRGPAAADEAAPTGREAKPCQVAFVFALGVESGGLVDLLQDTVTTRCASFLEHAGILNGRGVVVIESGVGRRRAARATGDLLALHKPAWVVSAGFAGALSPSLRRGHILMADRVADCGGHQLTVGLKMDAQVVAASKTLHVGRLLTVDRLIRTADEKRSLGQQHDAVACDMETMAVADLCRRSAVRFLSVRIITDAADERLPPELEKLLGQKSLAGKLGAAAGAIVHRPGVVKDLWKLKEDALKASDRLARFLAGVVPQLTAGT